MTALTATVKPRVRVLLRRPPSSTVTMIVAMPEGIGQRCKGEKANCFGTSVMNDRIGIMLVSLEMALSVTCWLSSAAPRRYMPEKRTVCGPASSLKG